MNLLIAIDGSQYTGKALEFLAVQRSSFVDSHALVLVHVAPGIPSHVTRHLQKSAIDDFYAEECAKVIEPVRTRMAKLSMTPAQVLLRHGPAAEEIVGAASDAQASMIVLGTHGHGLLGRALMGSVATKVVAMSELPVLLVR